MNVLFDAIVRFVAYKFAKARDGREIMYWSAVYPPQAYAGKCKNVSPADFLLAVQTLRSGKTLKAYMGWADCRICGQRLGTRDLGSLGFVWPERAEHYLEAHEVWTPGLDELVTAARLAGARPSQ